MTTLNGSERRIDGWKAIAAYFKRDRSTVMRWARDHDLPVRRMVGGKQGSVFAIESELAAWSLIPEGADAPTAQAALPSTSEITRTAGRTIPRIVLWTMVMALLTGLGIGAHRLLNLSADAATTVRSFLPADPAAAADYMTARDSWAERTPRSIARSIALYRSVIRREPRFAPAYSSLAEAWLIYREYGDINDPVAYGAARRAASEAIRLDPSLPSAHRALGFVSYWWSNDAPRALAQFRRAIKLDDHDAQSHFWYANVLADLGEDAAAQHEYSRARLLSPGSRVIEVEYACSKWQAGNDKIAMQQLSVLAKRHPDDATIHNCLAWVHISSGDIVSFAREYQLAAVARNEPQLLHLTQQLSAAVIRNPATAHNVLIIDARNKLAKGVMRIRETPAFFASAMGDRAALVTLLTEARNLGEHWTSASIRRRIARRWAGDAEVQQLVIDITPPPLDRNI